jgi:hypothetical protein
MDAHWESFAKEIVPMCIEQGIAIIGMKSFADGHIFQSGTGITPEEALRYTLSLPISTLVSGRPTDTSRPDPARAAADRGWIPDSDGCYHCYFASLYLDCNCHGSVTASRFCNSHVCLKPKKCVNILCFTISWPFAQILLVATKHTV